jgi:hypothetical protein
MEQSALRLIKRSAEYRSQDEVLDLPRGVRGIYVLYKCRPRIEQYDVVYVGMTTTGHAGGVRGRLKSHKTKKVGLWTHFSVFEVWDNIRDEEICELEGLFRHIYRLDTKANRLNKQRGFKKLLTIRNDDLVEWDSATF